MKKQELLVYLKDLNLTQADLARLLLVNPRTVGRWVADEESIPGPVERVLKAWLGFKKRGLVWRPDQIPFDESWPDYEKEIKLLNDLSVITEDLLRRIEARGGPVTQWNVKFNSSGGEATFSTLRLSFYRNTNDTISPAIYGRSDQDPDVAKDMLLLEDALYCIYRELQKHNGRWPA